MYSLLELQKALYLKLAGGGLQVKSIIDQPLQDDKQGQDDVYPYITFGDDEVDDTGGDSFVAARVTMLIKVFSRAGSYKELKGITDSVHFLLHRCTLSVAGGHVCGVDVNKIGFSRESDGITKYAVLRVVVNISEV
jgi:hypothetical protein